DVERRDAEYVLALGELAREVLLAALDLAPELVAEARGTIDPRVDRVLPAAARAHLERAGEAVVAERLERLRRPAPLARLAVAEHVRGHVHPLAERPLDGEAAAVERGRDVLDSDPAGLSRRGTGHFVTGNDARSARCRISSVLNRSSGVLLHPTSLPGGRLGEEAYRFVD